MSKFCDYEKDDFYERINKDKELFNQLTEFIMPHIRSDRLHKEKLNRNKLELVKTIKFYLSSGNFFKFTISDLDLSKEDVIEVSEQYGLYWEYDINYNKYYFMSKRG